MPNQKITVGILFGGKSAEHEVSLRSAKNVLDAIDKEKYNPVLIEIDKQGESDLLAILDPKKPRTIDVVFPILHGPFGEDGTVQGILKHVGMPFVGSSVLGSAMGMDKDVMKRLLRDAGIPIGKFLAVKDCDLLDLDAVITQLGLPCFVKPANLGSSVGVSKAKTKEELVAAVAEAFRYDRKIMIEEFIQGREIECAVLGNDAPEASMPGEIIVKADFYSYDAKYVNEQGAALSIPAQLSETVIKEVQELAVKTFKTLSCEGLGRVDFFLKADGAVLVNEINTMPGFTSISMYPQLWQAGGMRYPDLIDRLISLALERHEKESKLITSVEPK